MFITNINHVILDEVFINVGDVGEGDDVGFGD